jgi:hypothetical protein
MIDVLHNLGAKIRKKYEDGIKAGTYPKPQDVSDPALVDDENSVTASPIDRVYEHGFFPLAAASERTSGRLRDLRPVDGGAPDREIVPVEVKYDPRTGRQI